MLLQERAWRRAPDAHGAWLDALGNTPVHDAAAANALDALRALCDAAVPLATRNMAQQTPADVARDVGNTEAAVLLAVKGGAGPELL